MAQLPVRDEPSSLPSHALARLLGGEGRIARWARRALAALAVAAGLAALPRLHESLLPPHVVRKDFLQEYLLARAVAEGMDPYLPIAALAERYAGVSWGTAFSHPTPHPPPLGLLLLPLAWLDYPTAAAAWLAVELVALVAAVYAVALAQGRRLTLGAAMALALALVAWDPVYTDLVLGQLNILVLLLLAGGWLAWRAGRSAPVGVLLGLSLLVKPLAWPALPLFALWRAWRVVGAAAATALAGLTAAAVVVGVGPVASYLTEVLPTVSDAYRAYDRNISLWAVGWRLFDGTGSAVLVGVAAPPLVEAEALARLVSAALPIGALLAACLIARRERDRERSFALMVCLSVLVNPIAWSHYLVLTLLPLATVLARL